MELHELFGLKGDDVWFRKGDYFYTLEQVQKIIREVLRTEPERAQRILDKFVPSDKPVYKQ
ncbi:hypothetical protein NTE_00932 [Candidatus Nitrososphaera evergladensis SR1]|uniref:Uncharacterized protein n=1 Tax=Candidatus Nitrososphaera evergladensis SR1 TaxID=1459636 RepID=A0A075MP73_9ARCH|nr:hypothetical protein [Candidatus Nitrososphaera evergladensis]AIF83008.1 hypothetical protein NTE_00932 [Candidatus Nitrososphaera evergladensis SR1]